MDQANAGDHFVKIGIKIPKSLSSRQRELIKQFSVLEPPVENGVVSINMKIMSQLGPRQTSNFYKQYCDKAIKRYFFFIV